MAQVLRFAVQGQGERLVAIRRAFNIGFTIRDAAKMQAHLDEVAKEGVPMPKVGTPPIVFPLSPWAVTQDHEVPVQYARTSGEVEIVTIVDGGEMLVSVGSDHTDRELETIDIPWSKQACPSIVASSAWRWEDVAATWDRVEIGSEVGADAEHLHPYQRAFVREFMSPPEMTAGLLAKLTSPPAGPFAFWSGTVVSLESELEYPPVWRIWLENPVLGWRIEHTYRAPVLFAEVNTADMTFARRGTIPRRGLMAVITTQAVEAAAESGVLTVLPGDIVTPAARDRARALGVALGPATSGTPAPTPSAAAPPAAATGDLIEPLLAFALNTPQSAIPPAVLDHAAALLLDALSTAHAGPRAEGVLSMLTALRKRGGGRGTRVIGLGERLPAPEAALMNGALIHSLEFDPSHDAALIHPMAGVIPGALAAAEEAPTTSGRALLAAIAVAGEAICRISVAAGGIPAVYRCGAMGGFGAAIAAARLGGLDFARAHNALGITLANGAPPWQPHEEGSACHGPLPGYGARAGLLAVAIAKEGGTGPRRVLDGNSGYFRTYEGGPRDPAPALDGLGDRWQFLSIGIKPYPCGRLTHGAITAALTLRTAHGFPAADVRAVGVETGAIVATRTGRVPGPDATMVHQRLSVPFTVAQALIHGRLGLAEFGPGRPADPEVRRLMDATTVTAAADIPAPDICPVRVRVTLADGRTYFHQIDALLGNREWPLSRDQRLAKLEQCWTFGGQPRWKRSSAIAEAVDGLLVAPRLDTLWRAIG